MRVCLTPLYNEKPQRWMLWALNEYRAEIFHQVKGKSKNKETNPSALGISEARSDKETDCSKMRFFKTSKVWFKFKEQIQKCNENV